MLILSIVFDVIGWVSYVIPVFGESIDFIWAPVSALAMFKMYRGLKGKIAGGFSFIEEIFFGSDFVPSFTLMWFYTFVLSSKKQITNSN